jgi:hypothetical protein
MSRAYYELAPGNVDPRFMSKEAEAKATGVCPDCGAPKPGTAAVDATLQSRPSDECPINFVFGFGLGVARRDFLQSLGGEVVDNCLYIGRVFRQGTGPIADWVTFHGKHRIIVRGSKHAGVRRCSECAEPVYFSLGKQYLCPRPGENIEMFYRVPGGLVITEALVQRIQANRWRELIIRKLPVLDTPRDGIPNQELEV